MITYFSEILWKLCGESFSRSALYGVREQIHTDLLFEYKRNLILKINTVIIYSFIYFQNHDPRTSHVSITSTNKINIKGRVLHAKHDKQVSELKHQVMLLQNQIAVYEAITDELFRGSKEEEINTCFQRNEVLRKVNKVTVGIFKD